MSDDAAGRGPMRPAPIRLGAVGIVGPCRRHLLPALRPVPVELVAFCDPNTDVAERTAAAYGVGRTYPALTDLLANEDLDAVMLAVGPAEHPPLALEALTAGVHVWMEKPPAMRATEVAEIDCAKGD